MMVDGNDIYEEIDRVKQRISELEEKGGVRVHDEGEIWRGSSLTAEEQQELINLYARWDELKREDEKA